MKNIIQIMVILVATFAYPKQVPMDIAHGVAENVVVKFGNFGVQYEVATHSEQIGESSYFQVFNLNPGGFVIVSSDDRIVPVLGYSFESDFDPENIPPQLEYLINSWEEQIQLDFNSASKSSGSLLKDWEEWLEDSENSLRSVSPLIPANWDQGWSWNQYCPSDPSGPGDHVWAGCVAVSMAQVMKYWNYPDVGIGSHSYFHSSYGTLSADFGATEYNFSSMANNSPTTASKTLLYHCGVAVEMDYGPDGSGAYVGSSYPNAALALRIYFSYDSNLDFVEKMYFDDEEWNVMLRDELDASRPVVYRGASGESGHAWNIDGYQGSDYFHCNWGWSGYYNGYYYLDDLTPGWGSNFSGAQAMIIGIQPIPTDVPNIVLNPPSMDFGDVVIGSNTNTNFEIFNTGSQPLNVTDLNLVGDYSDEFSFVGEEVFTLNPGESQTVNIEYHPTIADDVFAIFQVYSNSYDNSLMTAPLYGSGIFGDDPNITISTASIDFDSVEVGQSVFETFFVMNTGFAILEITSIAVVGGGFSVDENLCSVASGDSCAISVEFTPADVGAFSGEIQISSNDPNNGMTTVGLFGEGVLQPYALGDVNNDGISNVLDVILTVNFILNVDQPDENQFSAADMNGDGVLNILDILQIVDLIINGK